MAGLTTVTGMARLIVGSVVIPFLFVIVMSGVEYLAKPRLLWDLMTDVGGDMWLLALPSATRHEHEYRRVAHFPRASTVAWRV